MLPEEKQKRFTETKTKHDVGKPHTEKQKQKKKRDLRMSVLRPLPMIPTLAMQGDRCSKSCIKGRSKMINRPPYHESRNVQSKCDRISEQCSATDPFYQGQRCKSDAISSRRMNRHKCSGRKAYGDSLCTMSNQRSIQRFFQDQGDITKAIQNTKVWAVCPPMEVWAVCPPMEVWAVCPPLLICRSP